MAMLALLSTPILMKGTLKGTIANSHRIFKKLIGCKDLEEDEFPSENPISLSYLYVCQILLQDQLGFFLADGYRTL